MKTATLTTKDEKTQRQWLRSVKANQDEYGWGVIEVVEKLGKNLDEGMDCATAEKKAIEGSGITGFMAGAMASMIYSFHPRGEEFKRYFNKQIGADPDAEGTANPAILTIGEKRK